MLRIIGPLEVPLSFMRHFVTGASGWIGSAVVPELIDAGHRIVGLARSDASAAALTEAGAQVQRGTLDDLDILRGAAAGSDGVIHLAFKHDIAFSGGFECAADADRPLVVASGTLGLAPGRLATERDGHEPGPAINAAPLARELGGALPSWRSPSLIAASARRSQARADEPRRR